VCAAGSCSRSLGCRSRGKGRSRPSLRLIDELDREIGECERELRRLGADHHYVPPLLLTVPGIGWVLAYTIAAEIGDIERFSSPNKLVGYTGLCPRVIQSGDRDRRGPLTKQGPKYLRWALLETTMHALRHPAYAERYQRTKKRLGKQRGAKVAQVDIARKVAVAIWHMLTNNEAFDAAAPGGAAFRLAACPPFRTCAPGAAPMTPGPPTRRR
jgi:transposase